MHTSRRTMGAMTEMRGIQNYFLPIDVTEKQRRAKFILAFNFGLVVLLGVLLWVLYSVVEYEHLKGGVLVLLSSVFLLCIALVYAVQIRDLGKTRITVYPDGLAVRSRGVVRGLRCNLGSRIIVLPVPKGTEVKIWAESDGGYIISLSLKEFPQAISFLEQHYMLDINKGA